MIVRVFHATTHPGQEGSYADFLTRTTIPFLKRQPGCREVHVGRHFTADGDVEFLVLTVWDTQDHLKDATGERWDQPVVDPEEAPLLSESDCDHYEEII